MTEEKAIKVLEIMKSQLKDFGMTAKFKGVIEMQESAVDIAQKSLSEIQQYRAIGTVEECHEAMERQRAKKPLEYETHEDYDDGICPNCKVPVNDVFGYCTDCGQSLLWRCDD